MEIGDSFVAPVLSSDARSIQALRQRVTRFQKQNPPKKFSVVQDGEQMRVFRVI
jgi:soluble cytochrome b562